MNDSANVSQQTINCRCGRGPKRPRQINCKICNSEAQNAYRKRRREYEANLHQFAIDQITAKIGT